MNLENQTAEHSPFAKDMAAVYLDALEELTKPYPSIKLPGWPKFNEFTGGLRPREFSILCGPTGVGKTTALSNISAQLITSGIKHFVLSVETGHTDYMKRIMSVLAKRDINAGDAVDREVLKKIHDTHKETLTSNLIEFSLYDNRLPVEDLIKDLKYMVLKKKCQVAIVDNLNFLLDVTTAANQIVEMDRVVHELIMFCKQHEVHLFLVMHPRKTDGGRVESEYDIKGSSTSVQEAHNIFLLNRTTEEDDPDKYDGPSTSDREIKIVKMRRRGQHVGRKIFFACKETVYTEKGFA